MTSYRVEMRRDPDLDDDEVARRLHLVYEFLLSLSESDDDAEDVLAGRQEARNQEESPGAGQGED